MRIALNTCLVRLGPKSNVVKNFYSLLNNRKSIFRCYSSTYNDETSRNKPQYSNKPPENPLHRVGKMIKSSFKEMFDNLNDPDGEYSTGNNKLFPSHCDVVIIGGGGIGSSIAYWLKQRAKSGLKVVVVERDPTYRDCSTSLSVGGLRQQFSLEENIQMSVFGAKFLRNIEDYLEVPNVDIPNVNFTPHGYLFMATEASAQILKENAALQASLGAKNQLMTPEMLKKKFPWLNTDGIALACLGLENEGWFDPWLLLQALRKKAQYYGAEYVEGEVVGFGSQVSRDAVHAVYGRGDFDNLKNIQVQLADGEVRQINFAVAVIAAGPHSGKVAQLAGIGSDSKFRETALPVEPRKRYVYCFHCPDGPGLNTPLTIDPNHVYFRREGLGGNYICGRSPSPEEEPDVSNLEVDHSYFEEKVWPALASRVPAFEKLKVTGSWAGYYDFNTFDENVIIGHHPYYSNLMMCTGCSGHGIQQAPALGRAMMELIIDGRYSSIDLSRLGFERLLTNEPMLERNIV
ncbi:FAD-dependent oxidoreductase domain-containing protein 1 isoform X1 [Nilaparvata lugens]|uniref:FAD-dependent oxidoreductase domain-containing protein 1 isoform X1 n=1 Tax=Nilaparvata lugens TaxID=108931 RepID=UPI00193E6903|nr:FAD-dependent oxidoreductase domain-containing protein 1 isoform X1 [Nilaparvata lugens]